MYAIYLRKSRGDRDLPNLTDEEILARHERMLTELAKNRNYKISKIYREVVSGETIATRPEMQKLLTEVEQGIYKGVLVVEIERLARGNSIDQGIVSQTFMYSDTLIITPSKTYNPANEFDEEFFEFGLFMSRREYKTINRRLQAGRAASHKEGKYVGSVAPYGYSRVKLIGQKGWTLEPDKNADIVRLIFSLYTVNNMGCRKICDYLNDSEIKSPKGGVWTPSVIRNMIRNEVYTGKIAHNKTKTQRQILNGTVITSRPRMPEYETFDGIHPAIIDKKIWESANQLMNSTAKTPVTLTLKNPLAGILICNECGSLLQRRPHSKNQPKDYIICKRGCKNIGSPLADIENEIIKYLKLRYDDIILTDINANFFSPCDNKPLIDSAKKKLITLNKQMDSLFTLVEQGIYNKTIFMERFEKLNTNIVRLENRIKALNAQYNNTVVNTQKDAEPVYCKLSHYYTTLSPLQKNQLLKQLFTQIIYTKEQPGQIFHLEFVARCDNCVYQKNLHIWK